jgi:methylmalonyl-CoA mutase
VLTGTNAYPALHETLPSVLKVAPVKPVPEEVANVTCEPLPRQRLAEPFEDLRDRSDQALARAGARPKIFLANLGTPAQFTARATFAKNFFEAGGIEAVGGEGELSALAAAYEGANTPLVCLCSSDKVYEKDASAAASALKAAGARHIYLAGRPGEREEALRAAGVQSFIYEGCDVLATLQAAYDILK